MNSTTPSHGSPPSIPARQRRLGLPLLAILGLALLSAPRVVLHDMGVIEEGSFINSLFVFIPPVIWVAVAVLMRLRRPFLTLLAVGVVYGVILALVHQIFWGAAFPGGSPELGGNLAEVDPMAQSLILRFFAGVNSLITGALVGVVTGLVAAGLSALLPAPRVTSRRSGSLDVLPHHLTAISHARDDQDWHHQEDTR